MTRYRGFAPRLVLAGAVGAVSSVPAAAQDIGLNYEALSSIEEPIAFDLDDVTVQLNGLVDAGAEFDLNSDPAVENADARLVANFQISAQTLLANRWRLGAAYFGQYSTDPNRLFGNHKDYDDNVAGFIGTSFGTFLAGNVSGQVREQTRRRRGAGNAFLAFDNFYGGLDNWGGAYVGRFGPTVLSAAVDENGDFEVGATFLRPIGENEYKLTLRMADGRFTSRDGKAHFDTKGVMAVADIAYSRSAFDLGVGYQKLESPIVDVDRWFVSAGMRTQVSQFRFSAEAHYGKAAGNAEKSAALGMVFDMARGLSLNFGVNYEKAQIVKLPVTLVSTDAVRGTTSLRFSF